MALLHVPFGKAVSQASGFFPRPQNPLCHYNLPINHCQPKPRTGPGRPFFRIEARGHVREESEKIRNRKLRRKFNGTRTRPRLSVFCSKKQLYAMLVDDQNKKTLFYASTLQKSVQGEGSFTTTEAARMVGEDLIKACEDLNISEISSYDRNGFARGERMAAFEIPISQHGFLLR